MVQRSFFVLKSVSSDLSGLYVEEHGIIANRFYESDTGDIFSYGSDTKWFNSTEPIWITAEREGKKSGAYMWVGEYSSQNFFLH